MAACDGLADGDGVTDGDADGDGVEEEPAPAEGVAEPEASCVAVLLGDGEPVEPGSCCVDAGAGVLLDPATLSCTVVLPGSPPRERPETSSTAVTPAAATANTVTAPTTTCRTRGRRGAGRSRRVVRRSAVDTRFPVRRSEVV